MRKLGLISSLWAALLFFPLTGFALGLGEIETSSFLNQPLKAKIEVISARPGEIDDLLISLASRDAFRKAGLERPAGLSKLRFKVDKSEDGETATILVSTKTPVKEPFLSFLVEADWAKGRLLREFTVLLDPPSFAQQALEVAPEQPRPQSQVTPQPVESTGPVTASPIATEAPAVIEPQPVESSPQPEISQPIAVSTEPEIIPPVPAQQEQDVEPVSDSTFQSETVAAEQIVVSKGDTLWSFAKQFKDDDHSMAQVMLAMQMMNPDAFGKDNINNLKIGAVLRAPDMDALNRLSKQDAYAQVLDQNGLWDEYVARKSGSTAVGTPDSSIAVEGSQQDDSADSQLSLLAPGDGDSDSASLQDDASSEDAGQIRKQLALAEEELEAARLENDDLKSRIEMLEQQQSKFEELQKLVEIQDSSLAQLQENAAAEEMTGMVDEQPVDDKPSDVMIEAAGEMLAEEIVETSDQTDKTVADSTDEMEDELVQKIEVGTVIDGSVDGADDVPVKEQDIEPKAPEVAPTPAPAIVTEAPDSSLVGDVLDMLPSLDSLLNDPIMLGGLGAILALLLGFVFLKRKKNTEDDEGITLEEPDGIIDDDQTPIHVPATVEVESVDAALSDTAVMDTESYMADTSVSGVGEEDEDKFASTAIIAPGGMPDTQVPEATGQEEQDDVLNEVDVYLAYGLYDNAEDLLNESLQNSPERADYRAKLLDTHFATKNKDAFVKQAEALKSLGGAADKFWDRIQIMGFELAPENDLFSGAKGSDVSIDDLEYAKPDSADFDLGADDDATDFSNTDFDLSGDNDLFDLSDTQLDSGTDDDFSETQSLEGLDVGSDDVAETDLVADFDIGDELEVSDDLDMGEDALSFDLPDDLDVAGDDADSEIIELEETVEAPPDLDEVPPMADDLELDLPGTDEDELVIDEDLTSETLVMPTPDLDTAAESGDIENLDSEIAFDEDLDFDMSHMEDASLQTGEFVPSDSVALGQLDEGDVTEFKPADVTGEFDALSGEEAAVEIDAKAGLEKTGTYAPGDFNEDDEIDLLATDMGDIEGLMLPDDVDEVGTKLDLAKAFIDMGDAEGARSSLEEVLLEGTEEQKAEATGLLDQIS